MITGFAGANKGMREARLPKGTRLLHCPAQPMRGLLYRVMFFNSRKYNSRHAHLPTVDERRRYPKGEHLIAQYKQLLFKALIMLDCRPDTLRKADHLERL